MENIFEKVTESIVNILGTKEDAIRPESRLSEDLGADSLDMVEIMMMLEESLCVEITDNEFRDIKTVGEITDLVTKKLEK